MTNFNISILGCGWLGLPLGESLVKKGFQVKGSTTNIEKIDKIKSAGIEAFLLNLSPQIECENIANFLNVNTLIINIPPKIRLNQSEMHLEQMKHLIEAMKQSSIQNIIYVSSTSVYPELNREVFEEDVSTPEQSGSVVLVKAENLLQENFKNLTVLRCGGLMGYDRIPAKYFSGWKGLTTGNIPVNFVHRDDVIGVIEWIIEKNIWGEVFNVVSPQHPIRKEIYSKNCKELGFELPEFIDPVEPQPFKIISPKKLIEKAGYQFKFENPLDFVYG
jgi:nucleoside-diphosphate-sugar epimerase